MCHLEFVCQSLFKAKLAILSKAVVGSDLSGLHETQNLGDYIRHAVECTDRLLQEQRYMVRSEVWCHYTMNKHEHFEAVGVEFAADGDLFVNDLLLFLRERLNLYRTASLHRKATNER